MHLVQRAGLRVDAKPLLKAMDQKRVAALHGDMLDRIACLHEILRAAPSPPDQGRPAQPCEVFIDTPYTRDDLAFLLWSIRLLKRQRVKPNRDSIAWLLAELIDTTGMKMRHHPTQHGNGFAPLFALLASSVEDVTPRVFEWLDAGG